MQKLVNFPLSLSFLLPFTVVLFLLCENNVYALVSTVILTFLLSWMSIHIFHNAHWNFSG